MGKHRSRKWLVLFSCGNGGGGMYPVSDGFLRAVKSNTRKYFWTGTIVTKAGLPYDFIALCCKMCRVEFANSRAEIDAMPNGG